MITFFSTVEMLKLSKGKLHLTKHLNIFYYNHEFDSIKLGDGPENKDRIKRKKKMVKDIVKIILIRC